MSLLVLVLGAAKFSTERAAAENAGGGAGTGGHAGFSFNRGESEAELELDPDPEPEEGRQEERPSLVEFQRRRHETTNQEELPRTKSSPFTVVLRDGDTAAAGEESQSELQLLLLLMSGAEMTLTVCLFILRLFLPVTASTSSRHVGSSRRRDGRLLPPLLPLPQFILSSLTPLIRLQL